MTGARRIALALLIASGCAHGAAPAARDDRLGQQASPQVTPEVLADRGLLLLRRGDYLRAEQYLQLALRAGHPEPPLIMPLLTACIASSRLRAALMHADRHLARYPHDWRPRFVRAALLRALGEARAAELEIARALDDAPGYARSELAAGGAP